MTQKTNIIFLHENYSKLPKKNYPTNKTDGHHFDNIWSLEVLDLKVWCLEKIRGFIFVLVVNYKFSKFGWTFSLKNKNAQTRKDSFENINIGSKRLPN